MRAILFIMVVLLISGCSGKTKEELYAEGTKQLNNANPNGAIVLLKSALEKDQNYLDARYQLAKAYMATGKFEQAEKEFQKVLLQNPSRSEIKLDLAKLYCASKKFDQSMKEATEYLQTHPGAADALEVIGVVYAALNKPDEAESYLLQTLKAEPSRTSAKLELAALYYSRDNIPEVRRLLDEVIKGDPQNSRAYYMLAALETAQGNKDKALEIYWKISELHKSDSLALYKAGLLYIEKKDVARAERIANDLITNFPKRSEGNRLKGLVQYSKKNYPEAITELQNSIKIQPTLEGYYFLGLSLFNQGDLETALSQFRKILDVNPSFAQARLLTGIILLKQQRVDDAITEIRKLTDADPRQAIAHSILGSAYMAKGMYDEGMKEFDKATEYDPKNIEAYLKKGVFHLSKGREREAETDLMSAVQVAPDILNTRMILVSYYMRQKNYKKALTILNQGLTGKKGDAPLYNGLAGVMFAQNKQAEGLKYLQKAKEIDPAFFTTYYNLATFYAAAGDQEKALNEYRAVLGKDPQNVQALLNMAAFLELKGRDSEAYGCYQKAKETKNVNAFMAMASYHMRKKESGKALAVLEEAIRTNPRNTALLELKGRILVTDRKYKEALKVFDDIDSINPDQGLPLKISTYVTMKDFPKALDQARRIITLKPNSASGYIILAAVYESGNDLGRAIEQMKNGVRVDGKNLQALMKLGNLYAAKKDYASAMATFGDALRINRDFAPALFAEGMILDQTNKKKEAIVKYQEALAKADDYVPALNNLAYLYADGYGSPKEALRLAIIAYKQEPGNTGVMDTLGYALLKNGRKADAQKVLEKCVALVPDNPTMAYHLSLAYAENGRLDLALKTAQKSLTLGDFPDSGKARKLLADLKR